MPRIAKAVWLDYCDGHMLDTLAREPLWQHLINYRCGTGRGACGQTWPPRNGRNATCCRRMIVTDERAALWPHRNKLGCLHKATKPVRHLPGV